jgi:hypothetical protein
VIFDLTGSYDPAWQIGTVIGITAGIVQIVFGGPPRRRETAMRSQAASPA